MLFVGSLTAENSSGYFDSAVGAEAIFYVVMAIENGGFEQVDQ